MQPRKHISIKKWEGKIDRFVTHVVGVMGDIILVEVVSADPLSQFHQIIIV